MTDTVPLAAPADPRSGRAPARSLPMGELAVAREGVLRTLLGSCLGLALYDRRLRIGALAHIVLPVSPGRSDLPAKYADTAIPAMLERLQVLLPGRRLALCAKFAGGANMFSTSDAEGTIGMQNVRAVERILEALAIPVVSRHCGGEQGRRMTFDVASGLVTIDLLGAETVTI